MRQTTPVRVRNCLPSVFFPPFSVSTPRGPTQTLLHPFAAHVPLLLVIPLSGCVQFNCGQNCRALVERSLACRRERSRYARSTGQLALLQAERPFPGWQACGTGIHGASRSAFARFDTLKGALLVSRDSTVQYDTSPMAKKKYYGDCTARRTARGSNGGQQIEGMGAPEGSPDGCSNSG